MSRWIDADTLIRYGKRGTLVYWEDIENAPSIDIVRCGECKHWDDRRKDAWWSEEGACDRTSRLGYATYRNHDDFCSYGERREQR